MPFVFDVYSEHEHIPEQKITTFQSLKQAEAFVKGLNNRGDTDPHEVITIRKREVDNG